MHTHLISTSVHGRYLVEPPTADVPSPPMLVGFHGYAELAEHMLDALRNVRGGRPWLLVSVQALNRFYTRSNDVVANWMTRQNREQAIADNIGYVASVVSAVRREYRCSDTVVYTGFSQGVAMAYRAAAFAADRSADVPAAAGAIMLAGDVPPDVAPHIGALPRLLIGRGTTDPWYTEPKSAADLQLLAAGGVTPEVRVFDGGHVWHDEFVAAAGRFLDTVAPRA